MRINRLFYLTFLTRRKSFIFSNIKEFFQIFEFNHLISEKVQILLILLFSLLKRGDPREEAKDLQITRKAFILFNLNLFHGFMGIEFWKLRGKCERWAKLTWLIKDLLNLALLIFKRNGQFSHPLKPKNESNSHTDFFFEKILDEIFSSWRKFSLTLLI